MVIGWAAPMSTVAGTGVSVISRTSPSAARIGRTGSSSGVAGGAGGAVVAPVLVVVVPAVLVVAASSSPAQAASAGSTPSAVNPSVSASRRVHVVAPSSATSSSCSRPPWRRGMTT